MPEGIVRTDANVAPHTTFRNGIPVTLPVVFGTAVTLPHAFGISIPVADATFDSNPVTWSPSPSHFGNIVGGSAPIPAPDFITITPSSGTPSGGTPVAIFGDGFLAGATVTIGGVLATSVVVVDSANITAVTPAGVAGSVNVVVTNTDAQDTGAEGDNAFSYVAPPAFVQQKIAFNHNVSTTNTIVFDAPAVTGDSIYVFVSATNNKTVVGVPTDDAGNTYTLVDGPNSTTNAGIVTRSYTFLAVQIVGTPQTVTYISSANTSTGPAMSMVVETNATQPDAVTSNAVAFLNNSADIDGGAVVSTQDTDLLLCFAVYDNNNGNQVFGAGTGWTLVAQLGDLSFEGTRLGFETQTAGAAGSYSGLIQQATGGNVGNGLMTTLALKSLVI